MKGRILNREKKEGKANLPIIGRLKVGEKTEGGYPRSLDYFKATGKYAQKFNEAYPGKVNQIKIFFASDDIKSVCDERYELWGGDGRKWGEGDGKEFKVWDMKEEQYLVKTKEEDEQYLKNIVKQCKSSGGWQPVLSIRFIIPKIPGVMGLWQLDTKGKESSMPEIINSFDMLLENLGTVRMVPFDLLVEKVKSKKPGKASVYPVIRLVPNIDTEGIETVRNFLDSGGDIAKLPQMLGSEIPALKGRGTKEIAGMKEDEVPEVFNG